MTMYSSVQRSRSPCPGQTGSVRSSGRLRQKSQRRFSMPSRKEELDRVVPDDKTPFKNYSDYNPRKLINNLVKGSSTYNNPDKIDLFDEFSDENFIDDGSSSDEELATAASSSSRHNGGIQSNSSSDSSADDESGATAEKPTLRRTRNQGRVSSTLRQLTDDKSNSEDELAIPLKTHKGRLLADQSSGSETSSGDDFFKVKRKKYGRALINSDGSSDGDDILPVTSIPDPAGEEGSKHEETHMLKEEKELDLNKDEHMTGKVEKAESWNESDSSFIATSSSSEDGIFLIQDSENDLEGSRSNKPSHEELICNYRQKKRRRKKSQNRKKLRVIQPSESDSSSESDDGVNSKLGLHSDDGVMERPHSKRAERLRRQKKAWKAEVFGSYKNEREKKLRNEREKKSSK